MFSKIFNILEPHSIGMILVLCLLFLLIDKKAIERINEKPLYKYAAFITIAIYYILIIIEVIENI